MLECILLTSFSSVKRLNRSFPLYVQLDCSDACAVTNCREVIVEDPTLGLGGTPKTQQNVRFFCKHSPLEHILSVLLRHGYPSICSSKCNQVQAALGALCQFQHAPNHPCRQRATLADKQTQTSHRNFLPANCQVRITTLIVLYAADKVCSPTATSSSSTPACPATGRSPSSPSCSEDASGIRRQGKDTAKLRRHRQGAPVGWADSYHAEPYRAASRHESLYATPRSIDRVLLRIECKPTAHSLL
jgi:hypothetical protein